MGKLVSRRLPTIFPHSRTIWLSGGIILPALD
jgi:hypothetical protein